MIIPAIPAATAHTIAIIESTYMFLPPFSHSLCYFPSSICCICPDYCYHVVRLIDRSSYIIQQVTRPTHVVRAKSRNCIYENTEYNLQDKYPAFRELHSKEDYKQAEKHSNKCDQISARQKPAAPCSCKKDYRQNRPAAAILSISFRYSP